MTIRSRYTSAITDKPWWLAGGIPRDACVAAYRAVGASDYASSKVNLANPGVYNATDGAAYPTWNTNDGWIFASTGTAVLTTGYTFANNNLSIFVRFNYHYANTFKRIFSSNADTVYVLPSYDLVNPHEYKNGTTVLKVAPPLPSGLYVMGIAGNTAYLNGAIDGVITVGSLVSGNLFIGNRADLARICSSDIYAVAVYNSVITSAQVSELTIAMNAL